MKVNPYLFQSFKTWFIKRLFHIGVVLLVFLLIKIPWILLFSVSGEKLLENGEREDIFTRRAYLVDRVYSQAISLRDMPLLMPELFKGEWAVGTLSMTAAALTNISFLYPQTRNESIEMVSSLIERIMQREFKEFDRYCWGEDPLDALEKDYGHIAYLGHLNFMLGAYHLLGGDDRYSELYSKISNSLMRRIEAKKFLNAETYPGEIYLMDNTVVVASLALYQKITGKTVNAIPKRWVEFVKANYLDPETGLIVFQLSADGRSRQSSKGSGAGWNSFYLQFIDSAFNAQQFQQIRKELVDETFFGATGIREWRKGIFGLGDVDSGPVLFGLSPSGTGFSIAGARHVQDPKLLDELLFTAELAGFSFQWNGKRRYLLAPLVGDAIVLAMKTAVDWDLRFAAPEAG